MSRFGKPKYGNEQFKKTGKPAKGPGNNYIRILPPMFSLAEDGIWAVYRTTHWGYSGVSPSDKTKPVVRPFLCIEERDRRSKMTTQECPECNNYNEKFEEAKAFEAALRAEKGKDGKAKHSEKAIETAMEGRKAWLKAHGPERKWYINVELKDGSFGDYKINHKIHKKGIDTKIKELLEESQIDALDPSQGVWFNIKRIGNGFDPPDVIEVEQEDLIMDGVKVPGGKRIKLAPLNDEKVEKAFHECRDLRTLGGSVLTYEQIAALVACSGDPEEVDKIYGGAIGGSTPAPASTPATADDDDEPVNTPVTTAPAAAKAAPATRTMTPEMKARAEQILAKRKADADAKAAAEAAAKAAELASAEPAAGVDPVDMDDDAFLEFFATEQAAKSAPA